MSSIAGRSRPVQQIPEPSRFWIGHTPRTWKATSSPWTHLACARLDGFQKRSEFTFTELEADGLESMLYLPPVDPALRSQRREAVEELREKRVAVLLQARLGEEDLPPASGVVYDLLLPLISGESERLLELPPGSVAVWPLISGITDPPELCDEGCSLLASCGVTCVQSMTVELSPLIRRKLAEGRDEDVFDALFHGSPMSERQFARIAVQHGLRSFMERPHMPGTQKFVSNRRIATHLAMIAELWLRLDRATGQGQALLRATRGAERTHHHLAALVGETNLKIIDWLDTISHDLIVEFVTTGTTALYRELLEEYLGQRPPSHHPHFVDPEDGDDDEAPPDDFEFTDDGDEASGIDLEV